MAKTTRELRFNELYTEYKILGRLDPDNLADNFSKVFNALLVECANELYDGDTNNVVMHKALWNNLVADKRTRFNNPERYFNGYLPEKNLKLELVELIATLLPDNARKVAPKSADPDTGKLSKSYWQYTAEDIEAVTDVKVLASVYNNLASAKSKETMLANAAEYYEMEVEDTKVLLSDLQTFAGQRRRELEQREAQPQISAELEAKLRAGKNTSLSTAEILELSKLLRN